MSILKLDPIYTPLPERLERLHELAYNLWWAWHPEARALYRDIDPPLWLEIYHNPVKFLREVRQRDLEAVSKDPAYLARYDAVMAAFDAYMAPTRTWWTDHHPTEQGTIAYFSAEFGLHESLPIYSGGLGVLSGDHTKEASDMGLPLVCVGFIYPQGYFRQMIDANGWQEAVYEKLNFADVPARPALTSEGREVVIEVDLPGRKVYAKAYRIQVGRVPLFMLDTDIHPNDPHDRQLAGRLYGGDQEMRISQEIVLGIGGVRALRALGIHPTTWHMNEGHAAFLVLELAREKVAAGATFEQARHEVADHAVFTTHTPVAAGHDAFNHDQMTKYFSSYWPQLKLSREEFLRLAYQDQPWGPSFSMTVLALGLSERANGVSQLHGEVSRKMWQWLYPNHSVDQVPIGAITNGVHTLTWLAPSLRTLYTEVLGSEWFDYIDDPQLWTRLAEVPDEQLWELHRQLRHDLIRFVRDRTHRWRGRTGKPNGTQILNPDALTIGFARRFATYKRATLLFSDIERLKAILHSPGRPVQFIFSGKAHPADQQGKEFIQQVNWATMTPGLGESMVFLEEYDMNVARYLVQGVDVWLNNPRRPLEASGTSGMKAALNGAPNLSVLDGWWAEAYNGQNGWAIGDAESWDNDQAQDIHDAQSLYTLLEKEVVPRFYKRSVDGVPHEWVQMMKAAIMTCAPAFSMRRMLHEYVDQLYLPAMHDNDAKQDE